MPQDEDELGSDLDDDEEEEATELETSNRILCQFEKVCIHDNGSIYIHTL